MLAADVSRRLAVVGCTVRQDWLAERLRGLAPSVAADAGRAAEEVLRAILHTDIRMCCTGSLPPNAATLHGVTLAGPFLLQIDELVNIGAVADERIDNGVRRCLKMALHDGEQPAFAMERVRMCELSTQSRAGIKIVVRSVTVRRGLMLLGPASCAVLGGHVPALLALQRGVRGATAESLQSRAAAAAAPRRAGAGGAAAAAPAAAAAGAMPAAAAASGQPGPPRRRTPPEIEYDVVISD